ncbi:hypothetical protein JL475_30785 [Streptomyces sp. M2CJ-2]|uniref:hypothetical protein n=1 Tax=Streptomyces sp. M2CJ-2 TaxID=2803948 RepID=UPI0019282683|nr:hypothetical protein [Streptomyces sp. M2CJ-2]MBL3670285.1 hypothetical protein [Streptomyces sp. M2CJ-2]
MSFRQLHSGDASVLAGAANFIPVAAHAWQPEEQQRVDKEISINNIETSETRQGHLTALGVESPRVNPDHKFAQPGNQYLYQGSIGDSAFNGNSMANRIAGIAPQ